MGTIFEKHKPIMQPIQENALDNLPNNITQSITI